MSFGGFHGTGTEMRHAPGRDETPLALFQKSLPGTGLLESTVPTRISVCVTVEHNNII
jgi:hypothetical protein